MSAKRGHFIALVGPDGSGKTSLATEILNRFDHSGYVHFRPGLDGRLPPGPEAETAPIINKHPDAGSFLASVARLLRSLVLFWFGYLRTVRPALRAGATVVADRWGYGYVGQPSALRYNGPDRLASLAVALLPRPDVVVSLSADPRIIAARKAELTVAEIEQELERWASLPVSGVMKVTTDKPPADLAATVVSTLLAASGRLATFKVGSGLIQIPIGRLTAGLALYAPARPFVIRAVAALARADRISVGLVGRLLSRPLAPIFVDLWQQVGEEVAKQAARFDSVAFAGRRQSSRSGAVALLLDGPNPVGFVKIRLAGDSGLVAERRALECLESVHDLPFRVPRVLGSGSSGELEYLVTTAMPAGPHRPADDVDLDMITVRIDRAFGGTSEGSTMWMHGDMAPWNLRRASNGELWLIDWEDVAVGPLGADAAYHAVAVAALDGSHPEVRSEAAVYWLGVLRGRRARAEAAGDADIGLLERMIAALG